VRHFRLCGGGNGESSVTTTGEKYMSQQNVNVKGAAKGPRNASLKPKENTLIFRNGNISVNDIFYSSWGYEQTNICFYQVVALKGKKTVVVRRIRGEETKVTGAMSGVIKPLIGDFIEEPIIRRVKECAHVPMIVIEDYENAYLTTKDRTHNFTYYG